MVRVASSLAALDGLFEHLQANSGTLVIRKIAAPYFAIPSFFATC
jgi:hypothetical protein